MSSAPASRMACLYGCPARALGRGDEPGAHLDAVVAHAERGDEVLGRADPAGADHRDAQVPDLVQQGGRAPGPGMAAGPVVDRDETVGAGVQPLERPLALRHVVVDDAAHGVHALGHPVGLAQRGDEEADAFLQGDVHPALHPVPVGPGRGLDEGVHAHRPVRHPSDLPEPVLEVPAVDVRQGDGLDDADAAGVRGRGHQLGVAARVHGAADEGHLDAGVPREPGVEDRLRPWVAQGGPGVPGGGCRIPASGRSPVRLARRHSGPPDAPGDPDLRHPVAVGVVDDGARVVLHVLAGRG